MPRPPRIDFPGARHHVMNRGVRRQPVFFDDNCYAIFLDTMHDVVERYGIRVHGFALMPNHYHLMIESVHGNLSLAMQSLASRYGQEINRTPDWDGSLFKGRFQSKPVFDPEHWLYLAAYLHLNPLRAHLVVTLEQWPWTSHDRYSGESEWPEWVTTSEIEKQMEAFGGYQEYLSGVQNGSIRPPREFDAVTFERRKGAKLLMVKQPQAMSELSADDALEQVTRVTGVEVATILQPRRGRAGNPARTLAIWWLIQGARLTNAEVAGLLGMSSSGVSKTLALIRDHSGSYHSGSLIAQMEELKALLND